MKRPGDNRLVDDVAPPDEVIRAETADVPAVVEATRPLPRPHLGKLWRKHHLGVIGILLTGSVTIASLIGPFFIDVDPSASNLTARLAPIGAQLEDGRTALLGTDQLGRDVLARVLVGGRASLTVVAVSLLLGAGLGTILGMIAGFRGGRIDSIIMRIVDAFLALPMLVLAMFVAATLGTGFTKTAITLGIASWPSYARLVRAEVLKIRQEEYIEASVAAGADDRSILWRHVLPNIMSLLLVVASLELGKLVLTESSLSYLGFGLQPPEASWGSMIRQGQAYVQSAWWVSAIPGFFIACFVLGLNLLGDWLRDLLDPHRTS